MRSIKEGINTPVSDPDFSAFLVKKNIEGWGGLRIEDDYVITENGSLCLTQSDDQHLRVVG